MLPRHDERATPSPVSLVAEALTTEVPSASDVPHLAHESKPEPPAADRAPDGPVEAIARGIAPPPREYPRTRRVLPPHAPGRVDRPASILVIAALVLVAVWTVAVVGGELAGRQESGVVASPSEVVASTAPSPSSGVPAIVGPSAVPTVVTPQSPISEVRELAVAPDGSAWLATRGGVVRWDVAGGTATLYGQGNGLPTTDTTRVEVGPDGTVWASGPGWVGRYDGSWTVFTKFGATTPLPDLGDIAAGPDGALWVGATDATSYTPVLLRYDGAWRSYELPEAVNAGPWAQRLIVRADRVVWAGSWDRLFRFDDGRWATYTRADTGLPRFPALAAIAGDGSVWANLEAEGCVAAAGGGATCATPAAGVARLRDGTWTVYSASDGLPANDATVLVAPDGVAWAFGGGRLSRFDDGAWTTTTASLPADARLAAVDSQRTLWFDTPSGTDFLTYDGSTVTRRVLPVIVVPSLLPELELTAVSGPTVTRSAIGTITWQVYEGMTGVEWWRMTGTPHGPLAMAGPDLRWISAPGSLAGTMLPAEAWGLTSLGDEVVAHGPAVTRLRWDGSRWREVDDRGPTGLTGFVEQLVRGPRGTIATGGETIWFAADGLHFTASAQGPDKQAGEAARRAAGAPEACPEVGGGSWPLPGAFGPAVATKDGFVVLASALVSGGNQRPLCSPLLWSSSDGRTWTLVSGRSPFGDGAIVQAVASRDGRHVAVGQVGADPSAWVSDDGISWRRTRLERPEPCGPVGGIETCSALMGGVQVAEEGWLAWSLDGAAWSSRDGAAWSQIEGWPGIRGGYGGPNLALGGGYILATGSLPGPWHEAIAIGTISP